MKKSALLLWTAIVLCFALMVFPGVFFINRIKPFILGMPFIYGATFILWAVLCILLFIGYKLRWGEKDDDKDGK